MQTGDWLSIVLIVATAVASFFGLKDFVRDRVENLQDQINELKIENERLKLYQELFQKRLLTQLEKIKNTRKR